MKKLLLISLLMVNCSGAWAECIDANSCFESASRKIQSLNKQGVFTDNERYGLLVAQLDCQTELFSALFYQLEDIKKELKKRD